MSGSLYLTPRNCQTLAPQAALVVQVLRDLELIGEPLGDATFAVAPSFNRHIVFAGCSPHLVYAAPAPGDLNFCHWALLGPYAQVRMITGPHTRRPRCPTCRKRAPSLQELLAAWRDSGQNAQYRCPNCDRQSTVLSWHWQRYAVFGRLLLAVRNVFPAEAVPSETLLHTLSQATGRPWDYGWAKTVNP